MVQILTVNLDLELISTKPEDIELTQNESSLARMPSYFGKLQKIR